MKNSSKPMTWFRLYNEAIDDEKLRLLAFEDRWHFVALLCCKSKGLLDSADSHDLKTRKIALKLGLSTRELDEVARRLAEVGLIDRDTLQPLAWDERQFQSDASTDRVRKFRERQKQAGNAAKQPCNVSVTVQETETDTETEKEPPLPPTGGAPDGAGGVERTFPDLVDDGQAAGVTDALVDNFAPSAGLACTTAGAACLAMKAAGIADTNPGNPKLRALLEAGASLQEFVGEALHAVASGKGRFAYVLGAVEGERKRAAAMASQLHQGAMPAAETAYQRSMRERVQEFAPSLARTAPEQRQDTQSAVEFFNAIEVPARTVEALK